MGNIIKLVPAYKTKEIIKRFKKFYISIDQGLEDIPEIIPINSLEEAKGIYKWPTNQFISIRCYGLEHFEEKLDDKSNLVQISIGLHSTLGAPTIIFQYEGSQGTYNQNISYLHLKDQDRFVLMLFQIK